MNTSANIYDVPVKQAEQELADARARQDAEPNNFTHQHPVERAEQRLLAAKAQRDFSLKIDAEHEAAREQRERRAREELEHQLIKEYMAAAPGTTEADAKAALPQLLHRHRLDEMGRVDREVAKARASGRYTL